MYTLLAMYQQQQQTHVKKDFYEQSPSSTFARFLQYFPSKHRRNVDNIITQI